MNETEDNGEFTTADTLIISPIGNTFVGGDGDDYLYL